MTWLSCININVFKSIFKNIAKQFNITSFRHPALLCPATFVVALAIAVAAVLV